MSDGPLVGMHGIYEMRICEIMQIMREYKWVRGKTGPILAERWDVSKDYVEKLAAEAWKRVKAEVTDTDFAGATIGTALEAVLKDAHDKIMDPKCGDNVRRDAWRAISQAAAVYASITVGTKESHEHTVRSGAPTAQDAAEAVKIMFRGVEPPRVDAPAVPALPAAGNNEVEDAIVVDGDDDKDR